MKLYFWQDKKSLHNVAPARERGLKSKKFRLMVIALLGRSREGAWIEIYIINMPLRTSESRSREGAWIEILYINADVFCRKKVAPARERGLKSVDVKKRCSEVTVAPARERGLK